MKQFTIHERVEQYKEFIKRAEVGARRDLWSSEGISLFGLTPQNTLHLAMAHWRLGEDPTCALKATIESYRAMDAICSEYDHSFAWRGGNEVNNAIFAGMVLYRSIDPALFAQICQIPRNPKESKQFFYHYMDAQLLYAIHRGQVASDWEEALAAVGNKRNAQLLHQVYTLYMGIVLDIQASRTGDALAKAAEIAALYPRRKKIAMSSRGDGIENAYMVDIVLAAMIRYFNLDEPAQQNDLLRTHLWIWPTTASAVEPPKVSPDSPAEWINRVLDYDDGPVLAQKGTYGFSCCLSHDFRDDPIISAVSNGTNAVLRLRRSQQASAPIEPRLVDSMLDQLEQFGVWELKEFMPRTPTLADILNINLLVKNQTGRCRRLRIQAAEQHPDKRALVLGGCMRKWLAQAEGA